MTIINTPNKKLLLDFYNSNCPFPITAEEIEKNVSLLWATHYLHHGLCPIPLKFGEKSPAFRWSEELKKPDGSIQLPQVKNLRFWWLDLPAHPHASRNQIGLACGRHSRNLVVFDFDGAKHAILLERFLGWYPILQETLWVQTGGGSIHIYCFVEVLPDDVTRLLMSFSNEFPLEQNEKKENAIELRANGVIVVAPPSLHPNGNPYKFANDNPIITVPEPTFNEILGRFNYEKKKAKKTYVASLPAGRFSEKLKKIRMTRAARNFQKKVELVLQIPIEEVAEKLDWDLTRAGKSWQGSCPTGHDSEGGRCFSVDSDSNLYHCFHCDIGGNVIQFVQLLTYRDFKGAVDWLWVEMLGGEKYDFLLNDETEEIQNGK